jgi:cell fate regulator YaaT (PSP1 superfamily)
MGKIIGVQFQKNGKMYWFDANGIEAQNGDYVIVDTIRGYDLGEVMIGARETDETIFRTPLKKVIRTATEQDIQHSVENREKEKEALVICQQKIAEHKLEMKLVSVEYAFDNSKILFFFTANGRVDFRSLVKDLASIFKMRIELRQIGVRDEAKMLGGLGPCGRTICCGSFLDQFQPVSIKMAKEQNLSLNPTKISGVCGRLMCCLKYEQDHYEQTRKKMPKVGKTVTTPDGSGPVTDLNIVKETVFVRLADGDSSEIKEYPIEMISFPEPGNSTETPAKNKEKPAEANITEKKPEKEESPCETSSASSLDELPGLTEKTVPNEQSAEKKLKNRQKNKAPRNNSQLGKPVKRENPNRISVSDKPVPETENSKKLPVHNDDKGKEPSQGETSWADALQKAIRAIHPDD